MFKNFYNGKRVFVTGHTGFKGTWLSFWLKKMGAEVCGFSSGYTTEPCNFKETGIEENMTSILADVRDYSRLKEEISKFKPDLIFHLAAEAIVRTCYDDPKLAFDTNLGGTVNVLNIIKEMPDIQAAVFITSDKCYENVEWLYGYRENDQLGGKDPYSASKACAEIAFSAYARSYFVDSDLAKVATVRAGNVIGGGDWANSRIVPDCFRAWSKGDSLELRSPNATRPWQHVLEPLSGYLCLGAHLASGDIKKLSGESFNFGPKGGATYTVEKLIQEMQPFWEGSNYFVNAPKDQAKKEAGLLKLCCDKAESELDWTAVMSFEETVEFTASWYQKYFQNEKQDLADLMIHQIQEYEKMATARNVIWTR